MAGMERNVFESENRAVVYLDLLGFAALVEASPKHFMTKPSDIVSSQTWPSNPAAERLAAFHEIIDSKISAEQPNHAMVFSDCAFGVFYTPTACADFAAVLMQDFLRAQVPVRMGLGFGTFHAGGTSTRFAENSTVVRSMFGGTSVVRAVTAEGCGGKGMRIFAHSSFSELTRRSKVMNTIANSCGCPVSSSPYRTRSTLLMDVTRKKSPNSLVISSKWHALFQMRFRITTQKRCALCRACLERMVRTPVNFD